MPDLTDIRDDDILIHADAKALTAIQTEMGKWSGDEKAHVTIKGGSIYMPADPDGVMDEKRKALIGAVDKEAASMHSVVRTRWNGSEFAFIVQQVHKPLEGIEK